MFYRTDDLRIRSTKVVLPPVFLEEEMPVTETASATVFHARREIVDILHQRDHRLLVVAGPCSIHDPTAARDYARRLKEIMTELAPELRIVMRVYFEKPRTTESQGHRQLASGLSCPVGFKNGTSGNVQIAIEAILSAGHPHTFLGHSKYGQSAILFTAGNADCHIILRGGRETVNYDPASVDQTCRLLEESGQTPRVMIDCSHANSRKDHTRQPAVCRDVAAQIAGGDRRIVGVMLESNLVAGAQKLVPGRELVYGQSITDACIGWDETRTLLTELAQAVRAGRSAQPAPTHSVAAAG
jgi:3-deoxy-D-arabino-heptulosonate 7-phosphate (DAHP) synthase